MRTTTLARIMRHDFVSVSTAVGTAMSRNFTSPVPGSPPKAAAKRQAAELASGGTLEKGCRSFNVDLQSSPAITKIRQGFLPASMLCHQLDKLYRQYSSVSDVKAGEGGVVQIELAQTGEGIADCELLEWFVQEGEEVEEFQPLCKVQSDKASLDITSRHKGKVARVNYVPGDIVKVGEILLELLIPTEAKDPASADPALDILSELSTESSESQVVVKNATRTTPAVRHLAKSHGIDLADVPSSGSDGRILKEDVMKFVTNKDGSVQETTTTTADLGTGIAVNEAESSDSDSDMDQHEPKAEIPFSSEGSGIDVPVTVKPVAEDLMGVDKIIPLRGFRRIMAKTMSAAVAVPHFYYTEDINVDALVRLKRTLSDVPLELGVKLTYLPFLIKALSLALEKYPIMNSTMGLDASEIVVRASHNVGVGMATISGLVVPNVKNVQQLTILEIATELSRLSQLAATNKLSNEDITGATISVSNFGSIGGKYGSPILNLPEVAIVAIGRVQKLPRFAEDGSLYPASIMGVTWGADHRVVDGATVASFCNQWKLLIERPDRFLLNMR